MTRRPTHTGSTRTFLPPRAPAWPPASTPAPGQIEGDELRVRAYLWRTFGIGCAARRHP
ncbi:hypothetical protein [Streptomyces sp. NPDC048623]|uniref:hypothetical protein n=1 Tax=Streptomyces sp. NPDC048623 TaxID=3155761 RepID=UPI0034454902